MVTPISQRDPRWGNKRIGASNTTVRSDGCTITSLSMALEKLRGFFCNPGNAAYHWTFNRRGEIIWKATKFNGMQFIHRGYNFDLEKIKEYTKSPNKAVIVEVNHGAHWVYVDSVSVNHKIKIIDPIDGLVYMDLPAKYKITGYAIFEATEFKIPEWMREAYEKGKEHGLKDTDPLTEITIKKLQLVLKEMGIIDKSDSEPTLGWLLAVMEKVKERW